MRVTLSRRSAAVWLSLAGVAVSLYLTVLHYAGAVPACPADPRFNCDAVLASPYGVIAGTGIPTSASGIVWFAISAVLWLRPFGWRQLAWSGAGILTVLYLVFVEIVLVGAICPWCTAGHLLVLAILFIALSMWTSRAVAAA